MPSITLSSAGTSAMIALDPISKATGLSAVVAVGSTTANFFIQGTMNDPTRETVSWFDISSAVVTGSSAGASGNVFYSVLSPLWGVRLSSSTFAPITSITLTALQTDPV